MLRADNTFVGKASSVVRVVVPRSVTMPTAEISSTGWISGVALVDADAGGRIEDRLSYYSFRFARCDSLPCDDYGQLEAGIHRLGPGNYDLYLITHGSKAEVALAFRELDGAKRLPAGGPVTTRLRRFGLGGAFASDGYAPDLTGDGIGFYTFTLDTSMPHAMTAYGHCVYRRAGDMPPAPYQPVSCPPVGARGSVVSSSGDSLRLTSSGIVPFLPAGVGLWYSSGAAIENVSGLGLWMKAHAG